MRVPYFPTALATAIGLAGVLGITPAQAASRDPGKPNILVVVADDMGYGDLGSFGSEIDTPNLDALAASGVQLTNFQAMPALSLIHI